MSRYRHNADRYLIRHILNNVVDSYPERLVRIRISSSHTNGNLLSNVHLIFYTKSYYILCNVTESKIFDLILLQILFIFSAGMQQSQQRSAAYSQQPQQHAAYGAQRSMQQHQQQQQQHHHQLQQQQQQQAYVAQQQQQQQYRQQPAAAAPQHKTSLPKSAGVCAVLELIENWCTSREIYIYEYL